MFRQKRLLERKKKSTVIELQLAGVSKILHGPGLLTSDIEDGDNKIIGLMSEYKKIIRQKSR